MAIDDTHCVELDVEAGMMRVGSEAVQDGRVVKVEEIIPATVQAVRDWLGY